MGSTFLQIFLLINIFIIGALSAIAARHAYAHYHPEQNVTSDKPHLSAAVKDRMLHASQAEFEKVLHHSVDALGHDLQSTSEQINNMIKNFAGQIVGDELERYRAELAELHKQAETDMSGIKQAVAGHQAELEANLAKEIEIEKQMLIKKIDTKLADAVGSFLLETLQHNVDLGNQSDYLVAMLEEHKADFAEEVQS